MSANTSPGGQPPEPGKEDLPSAVDSAREAERLIREGAPEEFLARTVANLPRRRRLFLDAGPILALQQSARSLEVGADPHRWGGFAGMLRAVIEHARVERDEVAHGLGVHPILFSAVVAGELPATEVSAEFVASLGRSLGLGVDALAAAVRLDADAANSTGLEVPVNEGLAAIRRAWDAAEAEIGQCRELPPSATEAEPGED